MTAAYAFTNYQSQDQTICYVLMDIARLPPGTLNLSNLYVTLSRSSGHDTIHLLLFLSAHSMDLLTKDDHLHLLDEETWKWWVQMMTDN
ncbi:hypothetical protein EDC04DRAFT_2562991 [Pisolithus marmoratus]|nr:hypothetical protein EDC04DRAFT_2562991 [Pisolithus marmoratus]